jgi:hypothetical protein
MRLFRGWSATNRASWVSGVALMVAGCVGAIVESEDSALSEAVAGLSVSTGVLACAPTAEQVALCASLAEGAVCTLTTPQGDQREGRCRPSLVGAVACAPLPPPPPPLLVDACEGKAEGDPCSFEKRAGEVEQGLCARRLDGAAVACVHALSLPQPAVEACQGKAKGESCSFVGPGGEPLQGLCGFGPAEVGTVLGCGPVGRLGPAEAACAGLGAGAACTLIAGPARASGSCTSDDQGAVVCVVACGSLGHPFGPGHGDGPRDPQARGDGGTPPRHAGEPLDGGCSGAGAPASGGPGSAAPSAGP